MTICFKVFVQGPTQIKEVEIVLYFTVRNIIGCIEKYATETAGFCGDDLEGVGQ